MYPEAEKSQDGPIAADSRDPGPTLGGAPEALLPALTGCAFRPRCRFAQDECAKSYPPLEAVDDTGHICACFRKHEMHDTLEASI